MSTYLFIGENVHVKSSHKIAIKRCINDGYVLPGNIKSYNNFHLICIYPWIHF